MIYYYHFLINTEYMLILKEAENMNDYRQEGVLKSPTIPPMISPGIPKILYPIAAITP